MIRILHTADWHIGHTFFGYDRTAEHLHFFEWLTGQLAANQVNALIVAGDVFDSMNPSAASQKMLFNFIRKAKKVNPSLQMIIIAGSHDSPGRLEAPTPLLEDMDITIKGQLARLKDVPVMDDMIVPLKGDTGQVEMLCLLIPHIYQSDYSTVEGVKEYYSYLLRRASEIREPGQELVLVGYLNVAEVKSEKSTVTDIFATMKPVTPDFFGDTIKYAGLGYNHKAQEVGGLKNIRYAGSPLPMCFEERDIKRSCILVTMPDSQTTIIEELEYTPMTRLISIPENSPRPEKEIMEIISQLPEINDNNYPPFLEIRVLISEPEPMLRLRIEKALEKKAVRLARIVTVYRTGGKQFTEEEIMTVGLQEMSPIQIARITYEKMYQEEMSADLEELFNEVCQSSDNFNKEML